MANAFVRVAPDSSGKFIQTFENTISSTVVEAQAFSPVDTAGVSTMGSANAAAATPGQFTRNIPHAGTARNFYGASAGVVAGTTATAALVTLSLGALDGSAPAGSATTFVLGTGKRLRFTAINVILRGHATATTASLAVRLVANTAGAVTTTSNIQDEWNVTVPAVTSAVQTFSFYPPEGFELVSAASTFNYGFVVVPTFVTNAPTYWIYANGYEY